MGGYGGQGGQTHQGGISVYASGYSVGTKLLESFVGIPGADGMQRFDGGTFGVSGWVQAAVSTRVSSIIFATAMALFPRTGLAGLTSGYTSEVGVNYSGNAVDFTMYHNISGGAGAGGLTSSGTSTAICWLVIGK